ncbi:hypothetical protein Q5P01_017871 [Channa striata]|uniref:Uncharacterized protein n=1 Tax=Channa striata TaxID=64152 RepID=A0AA88S7E1_CHASR|nr:hypothetical protein Q5P01_017871 [Channa striata]
MVDPSDSARTFLCATVEIDSPPLKPFSRPHISDGPVSFADLLKDDLPGAPGLELLEAINTSVKLASVGENLDSITGDLKEFDKRYDKMTAGRVSFGGWLSGFASDAALWTSVAILTTWCRALLAGIAYLVFCGGGNSGGGGGEVDPSDSARTFLCATRNSYVSVARQLVEVSNKLDANVALINGRIDEQERKMKKNTDIANKNFAMLRDAMKRNTPPCTPSSWPEESKTLEADSVQALRELPERDGRYAGAPRPCEGPKALHRAIGSRYGREGRDGKFYEPSECHGKYCAKPKLHERYLRCTKDPSECKTVCGPCHRGICYRDNKVTWMEGSATVEIDSPPLKPFSRPHISDGPVSFADLLKDDLPGVPGLELLEAINTSVKLASMGENLNNITRDLKEFDKRYDEMTAGRVSFGGWLSGFASDAALWTSVAILTTWCGALLAGIAYLVFCGGGNSGAVEERFCYPDT